MVASIPPIISVDDHVVEPPHLWQRWLPAKHREQGPRVVEGSWEMVPEVAMPRAYRSGWTAFRVALSGPVTDWWVYEDHVSGTLIGNACAGLAPEQIVGLPDSARLPLGVGDTVTLNIWGGPAQPSAVAVTVTVAVTGTGIGGTATLMSPVPLRLPPGRGTLATQL